MKQFVRVLTAVLCTFVVMVAYAAPKECKEPPGQAKNKGKPSKVTILHCGCNDGGTAMEYVQIQVSSKSRGHLRHEAGSFASCSDGSETYTDFLRIGSDCQVDDGTPQLDGLEFCNENQLPMEVCGEASMDG